VVVKPRDEEDEDVDEEARGADLQGLSKHDGGASPGSLGVLLLVCVLVMLGAGTLTAVALVRRRHKHNLYAGRNVLTFANPNYNAQEGGGAAGAADRRPFLWKKLKYEKAGPAKAATSLGRHEEGIILCAVPELKSHAILDGAAATTTNVDERHDDIYSEITVPDAAN